MAKKNKFLRVMGYGTPVDPQAWNRMDYADKQKKLKSEIGVGDSLRRDLVAKQQKIADARRNYYYGMVAPLEKRMSESVVSDLTTDRNVISDRAAQDVADAFSKARAATQRTRDRYGIKARPEDERIQNIEEARAKANAGNQAVDETRGRGMKNAAIMSRLGMNMPGEATAAMQGAGGAMANQYDFQAMLSSGKISDNMNRDMAGSSAIADIFQSLADGGEVRGDKPNLNAIEWLREKLTGNRERPTYSINRDETRKLRDLEEGRYADGGQVGYGMRGAVDLETHDYVIPEDVVSALGVDFFEQLVEEAGA